MVNVRNLLLEIGQRFGRVARERGEPLGLLLTRVLQDWLSSIPMASSRQERVDLAAGMWSARAPERRMVDELIAERRAEAAAEELE